jgi:hypothetical protein
MVDAAQLPAARRGWWPLRRRRRDLRAVPFPEQALQQWQDPEVALALVGVDADHDHRQGPREGDAARAPAAEAPVAASSPPPAR